MAETRLSDIIEPSVFTPYVLQRTMELSVLYESGIIAPHETVSKNTRSGGSLIDIPFWNDLGSDESNVGSDNPGSNSAPKKITAGKDIAIKHRRNQSWSSMDLTGIVAGDDPMKRVGDRVSAYWARDMQRTAIATLTGLFADNGANDNGDMIVNIANDSVSAVADAELISAEAVIDAMQTLGDAKNDLVAVAMHSAVHARLQKLNLIDTVHDSNGNIMFTTYLDKRVIVDDGCPAVAGTNRITYSTYLFGKGALAHGDGAPRTPTEVDRLPAAGDGEGQEVLYSRQHYVLHPRGVKFTSSSIAGVSPTNTELQAAANWDRVHERKAVRLVELKTNG